MVGGLRPPRRRRPLSLRIALLCVGRLGVIPEARLAADWTARATNTGRALGLGPVEIIEVEGRRPGKVAEAEALGARLENGFVIACDEHGAGLPSRGLAELLARLRDDGITRLIFVVGGADGLDAAILSRADRRIAFGPQTWPHALARAMLAEQVYRAATLMAGMPYHRD